MSYFIFLGWRGDVRPQKMWSCGVRTTEARGRMLRVHAAPAAARAAPGAAGAAAAQLSAPQPSPDTVLLRPTTPSIPQTARRLSEWARSSIDWHIFMYSCDSNVSLVLDCVSGGAPSPDRTTAMRLTRNADWTYSAAQDATLVCTSMKCTEFNCLFPLTKAE